jgi:hypothetical protein
MAFSERENGCKLRKDVPNYLLLRSLSEQAIALIGD